jgi:protein TonB
MIRSGISFTLSVTIHAVLLTILTFMLSRGNVAISDSEMTIRITLNARSAPAIESPAPPQSPPPTPVQEVIPVPPVEERVLPKPEKSTKKTVTSKPSKPKPRKTQERRDPPQPVAAPSPAAVSSPAAVARPAAPPRGRVSEGGAPKVVLDVASLKITKKISPEYPLISRKRRDQGTVILLIKISTGRVESVNIEKSSGHAPLDESAVRAVKGWQFNMSGYGNEVLARIPFSFSLTQ